MKRRQEAQKVSDTTIITAHDEEIVCASCGFDLDEDELSASKCSDCGQPLELKKSISIEATSVPLYGDS